MTSIVETQMLLRTAYPMCLSKANKYGHSSEGVRELCAGFEGHMIECKDAEIACPRTVRVFRCGMIGKRSYSRHGLSVVKAKGKSEGSRRLFGSSKERLNLGHSNAVGGHSRMMPPVGFIGISYFPLDSVSQCRFSTPFLSASRYNPILFPCLPLPAKICPADDCCG